MQKSVVSSKAWKAKALTQWAVSYLPMGERVNHSLQRARGAFSDANRLHAVCAQGSYLHALNNRFPLKGKTVVEIGPGWQGVGTLLLHLFGVGRVVAFDHQPHLRMEMLLGLAAVASRNAANISEITGLDIETIKARTGSIAACRSPDELLAAMHVDYRAPADAAATGLARRSVDLVYSYGVLEHIDAAGLRSMFIETNRILTPNGRASHNIGLHDHFQSAGCGSGVNFLRYSQRKWDFWCGNALLYHNRMRAPDYLDMFDDLGMAVAWQDKELTQANLAALRGMAVHSDFHGYSDEDLAASHLYVDLSPSPG